MNWGLRRPASLRSKLFLLLFAPFLVALGAGLGGFGGVPSSAEGLVEQERWLTEAFDELMRQAGEAAEETLRSAGNLSDGRPLRGPLRARVEGSAILGEIAFLWRRSKAQKAKS